MNKKVKKCISISKKAMDYIESTEEKTSRFIEGAVMDRMNNASSTKLIAFANFKGGVGKTTIAHNVTHILGSRGKKVLAVDVDPQGNLTSAFSKYSLNDYSLLDVLTKECKVEEAIVKVNDNIDLIPSNVELIKFGRMGMQGKGLLFKNAMKKVNKADYDFIIFDCAPSSDELNVSVYSVANSVYVPITPGKFPTEGVAILEETVEDAAEMYEHDVEIKGVFLNMSSNEKVSNKSYETLHETFGDIAFKSSVRRLTRIVSEQFEERSVVGTNSEAELDLVKLVDEILEKEGVN